MADEAHLEILQQGVDAWNQWRNEDRATRPDLSGADLTKAKLSGALLTGVDLTRANLSGAVLRGAGLNAAKLHSAKLVRAHLTGAHLRSTDLTDAELFGAQLSRANLSRARLSGADLEEAGLQEANLTGAYLTQSYLADADLTEANLTEADLTEAELDGADLSRATLVSTIVEGATLKGASVFGASVWNLAGSPKNQNDLLITSRGEPAVTVDDLRVAQFVYLLLDNPAIRDVIDTIGEKGVLILGRFGDRKPILNKLRTRLRELGFAPMVFDFEKPTSNDFTETVKTLAGMSAFIVADITAPKSVPQEAQAVIPEYMVPFVPLIEDGQEPWAMFQDLWIKHRDWVLEPLVYSSVDDLIPRLGNSVVTPALERRKVLLARRAEEMGTRSLDDFALDNK